MSGVTAYPTPLNFVRVDRRGCLFPQREILHITGLSFPPPRNPARQPLLHSIDDVLRIAGEQDAIGVPSSRELAKCFDDGAESHSIVGCRRFGDPVVVACDFLGPWMEPLNDTRRSAGILAIPSVAEAGFIGIDGNQITRFCLGAGQRTTSKLSISSR